MDPLCQQKIPSQTCSPRGALCCDAGSRALTFRLLPAACCLLPAARLPRGGNSNSAVPKSDEAIPEFYATGRRSARAASVSHRRPEAPWLPAAAAIARRRRAPAAGPGRGSMTAVYKSQVGFDDAQYHTPPAPAAFIKLPPLNFASRARQSLSFTTSDNTAMVVHASKSGPGSRGVDAILGCRDVPKGREYLIKCTSATHFCVRSPPNTIRPRFPRPRHTPGTVVRPR